ncbi:hypothetical protein FQU78_09810 [Methanosarcina mazei]|uniref:Uncharacterized protein n=1 Tax=Methanosarcina mazei TaxID=2209 RepID=A0A6C0VP47_METMZ|nr:hypothetical protein FQU78_09810 [Methanosarcina mazei]
MLSYFIQNALKLQTLRCNFYCVIQSSYLISLILDIYNCIIINIIT